MDCKEKELDLIAVGNVAVDYFLLVETLSWEEEKRMSRGADLFPGGTMGNVACAAARLGLKSGIAGMIGEDPFGELLLGDFKEHGVDVRCLRRTSSRNTPVTVTLRDDAGRRTMIVPPAIGLLPELIDDDQVAGSRILHTHLLDPGVCLHYARLARRHGVRFSIDLELQRLQEAPDTILDNLLSYVDVLFCNRAALRFLVRDEDIALAAGKIKSRGPEAVVVTLGEEGSLAVGPGGEVLRTAPYRTEVVDPTGAGDCFVAAFHFGTLQGWTMEESLGFASAASALAVSRLGPRAGLPAADRVLALMAATGRE